jgi:hypothetical protein
MTITSEWIVGESKGSESRHVGEHFARHRGDVVVVQRQDLQLVKVLNSHLVDADNLIVIQLKAAKCWNAFKHSLRYRGDLII